MKKRERIAQLESELATAISQKDEAMLLVKNAVQRANRLAEETRDARRARDVADMADRETKSQLYAVTAERTRLGIELDQARAKLKQLQVEFQAQRERAEALQAFVNARAVKSPRPTKVRRKPRRHA